jgi:hypothetical protein
MVVTIHSANLDLPPRRVSPSRADSTRSQYSSRIASSVTCHTLLASINGRWRPSTPFVTRYAALKNWREQRTMMWPDVGHEKAGFPRGLSKCMDMYALFFTWSFGRISEVAGKTLQKGSYNSSKESPHYSFHSPVVPPGSGWRSHQTSSMSPKLPTRRASLFSIRKLGLLAQWMIPPHVMQHM